MTVKDGQLPLFSNEPVPESAPEPVRPANQLDASAEQPPANDPLGPDEAEMAGLVEVAIAELRAVKGDARLERAAVCRWFKRGTKAGFSTEALVDVLGVSNDVLDGAGYDDEESQRVMDEIVADISDAEIDQTALDA